MILYSGLNDYINRGQYNDNVWDYSLMNHSINDMLTLYDP